MKNYINQMQKIFLAVVFSFFSFASVFAQVETAKIKDGTISNGAAKAKDGAIFELESNNKGMLISRLSTAQRNAIPSANLSNGLLVFNTNTNCFDYWDSLRTQWLSMCGTPPPAVFDISSVQCSAIVANGTYKQGVTLSGDNTLTIPVTVTQPGTYTITATTANGYYFEASGNFPSASSYELTLRGTGRPNNGYATGDAGDVVSVILNGIVNDCQPTIYVEKASVDFSVTCASIVASGNYNIGLNLAADNKLTVNVNVTNTGFWNMSTNTVNGYSFNGQGTFTATGSQTVVLQGTGKPETSGTNLFNLSSNANSQATASCSGVPVTVAPVAYTMNCADATQNGSYMQNVALNSTTNTITLPVNVTATGNTTITTNTVNGVSFSSGPIALTAIGIQNIVLKGSGTPLTGTTTTLTLTGTPGATATCSFDLEINRQPTSFAMTCSGITTSGTYVPNVIMDPATNTMTIPVTVTYAGDWSASTNSVNGVSFSGSGTFTTVGGGQSITLKATGTPTSGGPFTYTIDTNSASSGSCTKSILFVYRTMNVLGLGSDSSYNPAGLATNRTAYKVLSSLSNFGPSGKVKMMGGFKFSSLSNSYGGNASAVKDKINTDKIDIIYIAHGFNPEASTIAVLKNFVQLKKGVLIFANEYESYIKSTIDAICGSNVTTSGDGRYLLDVPTSSEPILTGPFTNVSGLIFGGDVNNNKYIDSAPANSTVLATTRGGSKVWSFKLNDFGFVWIGDGGFNAGYPGNTDPGNWPAAVSDLGDPLSKSNYGNSDDRQTIYNSAFYANLFAWAIKYAQENTDSAYIIP